MPCRVGITTNVEARRAYWEKRVRGFANWQTHGWFRDKRSAQLKEDGLVADCNRAGHRGTCHGQAGGGDPNAEGWTVYSFDYHSDPGD